MTRRVHPIPRLDPDIARLAGALADPSRIAMLDALLDGSARPIGALAHRAGISAATASGHLRRLIDHPLVVVDRDGPSRRVRLAGPRRRPAARVAGSARRQAAAATSSTETFLIGARPLVTYTQLHVTCARASIARGTRPL